MGKYLDKPFFLPCMTFLVGLVNSVLNVNRDIEEVWWYTIFPAKFGMLWILMTMWKVDEDESA
jgi:hypothetical protein